LTYDNGEEIVIKIPITNVGNVAGDVTPQIYLGAPQNPPVGAQFAPKGDISGLFLAMPSIGSDGSESLDEELLLIYCHGLSLQTWRLSVTQCAHTSIR
jgi:hypothetical protein